MIHPPWRRIHVVMYLYTAAFTLLAIYVNVVLLSPGNRYMPGGPVVIVATVSSVLVNWLLYFGCQRSAEVRDGHLRVRSWLRWWRLGTDRSFDLRTIERALLLRPYHVELAVAGARRVHPYGKVAGIDQFGTFWWYAEEYGALEVALQAEGLETEYRDIPGYWWQ